jgi:hypothetical protein
VSNWPDLYFGPVNLWTMPSTGVVQVLAQVEQRKLAEEVSESQKELNRLLSLRKS